VPTVDYPYRALQESEFSRGLGRASSILLALVAAVCAAVAGYAVMERAQLLTGAKQIAVFVGAPLAIAATALVATRLPVQTRLKAILLLVSLATPLFMTELYLLAADLGREGREARARLSAAEDARRAGRAYDERSIRQLFIDEAQRGQRVYPRIYQLSSRTTTVDGKSVFPTSNVSGQRIVECFGDGRYKIYPSDEYGFDNPPGLHAAPVTAVLIGDSFTAGECVDSDRSIAAVMRLAQPRTLSLGIGGAGPLWELANLVEFGLPLRPEVVFWLYYEGNDFADLMFEASFPELTVYLASDARRLRERKAAVDARVEELQRREVEGLVSLGRQDGGWPRAGRELGRSLLLSRLRLRLGLHRDPSREDEARVALLGRVVARARDLVESQGGRFVFVYVPDWSRFGGGTEDFERERVLAMLERESVPTLDLLPALERHPDPLSLYPQRQMGHFNEAGYRFIA
jgi:hypothetical protein